MPPIFSTSPAPLQVSPRSVRAPWTQAPETETNQHGHLHRHPGGTRQHHPERRHPERCQPERRHPERRRSGAVGGGPPRDRARRLGPPRRRVLPGRRTGRAGHRRGQPRRRGDRDPRRARHDRSRDLAPGATGTGAHRGDGRGDAAAGCRGPPLARPPRRRVRRPRPRGRSRRDRGRRRRRPARHHRHLRSRRRDGTPRPRRRERLGLAARCGPTAAGPASSGRR